MNTSSKEHLAPLSLALLDLLLAGLGLIFIMRARLRFLARKFHGPLKR